jgi:putative Holliday junction resolvase
MAERDGGMADEGNRILAVDWGERRVGFAISDTRRVIASPAGFLVRRAGKRPPIAKLVDKAKELGASSIVLGLPLDGNGDETPRSGEVRRVAEELTKRTGMSVELVDERYTTAAARRAVRTLGGKPEDRPGDVDALSATVLLQHVLSRGDRHEA